MNADHVDAAGTEIPDALSSCLVDMAAVYRDDPVKAVRGQAFIKLLHAYLINELTCRLTPEARRRGITVVPEATLLGSHKPKDVDVSVIHPENGPLVAIGVRSQMSSIGKNALNYYEGIIGECISLQDRFPRCTFGYVYLMPLAPIKEGKEEEQIDHRRWARLYEAITGRSGLDFAGIRGVYDEFAYLVVDFDSDPPVLRDDLLDEATEFVDLSITNFVDRIVTVFNSRMLFWDVFEDPAAGSDDPS